ncbi:MAG: hypothetical protein LBO20_08495 [Bifidobacteriaceae bacterium]|jgi:predicted AAA+ superfamily ATPase|nr:hypothetical protein [Bifidobacteriaceae bacterium]
MEYRARLVDGLLDELQPLLPALVIDGPRAVGKTATAQRRAASVFSLDRTAARARARRALLDGYVDNLAERDIPQAGGAVTDPVALRAWLAAYGAATATTASHGTILAAAATGDSDRPGLEASRNHRGVLERAKVLDPLPAWTPSFARIEHLAQHPKHHLVDPALAARLVGSTREGLLQAAGEPDFPRADPFLGPCSSRWPFRLCVFWQK